MKRIGKNIAFILIAFLGLVSFSSKEEACSFQKNQTTVHTEVSHTKRAYIQASNHKNQILIAEAELMETEEDEESESLHKKAKLSICKASFVVNHHLRYKTLQVALDRDKKYTPYTYTYPEKYILFQVFRI